MTNPMTPTEQDKELRTQIRNTLYNHEIGFSLANANGRTPEQMVEELIDAMLYLATADRKHVALEARLEALDHIIDLQSKQFNRWTQMDIANFFNDVGKYYRELKSQLEEV